MTVEPRSAERYDAIVIGAGPSGCVSALLLARAGWQVALLEKQPFPRRKVCGVCIAASNLPLLDALGLGAAFAARAGPELERLALLCGAHTIEAALPSFAGGRPWGRALGRECLDSLLLEGARAAGAAVLQPWSVRAIEPPRRAPLCEVLATPVGARACGEEAPRRLRAPVVIRAQGSWQALRAERSRTGDRLRASDLLAFKASFTGAELPAGELRVLCFPGGYGGMVLADRGMTTLACCIRADQLARRRACAPGRSAGAIIEDYLRQQCTGVREALQPAARIGGWLAAGPIRPGVRLSMDEVGVFMVGNAAGEVHPIIGEGISMAMQSSWLLCERLLRNRDLCASGNRARRLQRRVHGEYAADWRAHFGARRRLASAFAHAAMQPLAWGAGLALLSRAPALLTRAARWSGKTRCAVRVPA